MELNDRAEIDTSQIEDRTGSPGRSGGGLSGLPIPVGGRGVMGLIVTVVILLLGGGGYGVSQLGGDDTGDNANLQQECSKQNPDRLQNLRCRNNLYVNSIQDYWRDALPRHFNRDYQPVDTVFFRQATNTGCGAADSGVGPFYCPADRKVFIDLSFYDVLARQLGAPGEFAQPYVLAHEYGHHVQTVLGTEAQMRRQQQRDPGNANELSVRLELQADCYAGAWAKHATETDTASGEKIFTSLTATDIQEGMDTAAKIGDDALQRRSGGTINPAEFTHGSSQQRVSWFRRGYDTGDPGQCDTFSAARI